MVVSDIIPSHSRRWPQSHLKEIILQMEWKFYMRRPQERLWPPPPLFPSPSFPPGYKCPLCPSPLSPISTNVIWGCYTTRCIGVLPHVRVPWCDALSHFCSMLTYTYIVHSPLIPVWWFSGRSHMGLTITFHVVLMLWEYSPSYIYHSSSLGNWGGGGVSGHGWLIDL